MKKIKSILAMILSLVMIMSMSAMAFAAEPDEATITIHNAGKATVTYLHVIEPDDATVTGWKFVNDEIKNVYLNAFGSEVAEDPEKPEETVWQALQSVTDESQEPDKVISADQVAIAMLIKAEKATFTDAELKAMSPSLKYLLTNVNAASAAQIDKALAALDSADFISTGLVKGEDCVTVECKCTHEEACGEDCTCEYDWTLTVNTAGIYAIRGAEATHTYKVMAAYVGFGVVTEDVNNTPDDSTDDVTYEYPALLDTEVNAKKSPVSVDKKTEDTDLAVGINDIVTYVIEVYVPFLDPVEYATERTFSVTDTITGAEYYLSGEGYVASVKMNNQPIDATIVENEETDAEDFVVNLDKWVQDLDNPYAGNLITITYTAKVTDLEVENTAASHIPGKDYNGDPVNVWTGKIVFTKYNEDKSVQLGNAGFKVTDSNGTVLKFTKVGDGLYTYDPTNGEEEVFTAVADVKENDIVVREEGTVTIQGLGLGTYTFTETSAPKGYSINEVPVSVTLDENDFETTDKKSQWYLHR